jgi:hypothetical protein
MADAGKEGLHKPLTRCSYGNGANVQSVRACALEAHGRQREWENYITHVGTFARFI